MDEIYQPDWQSALAHLDRHLARAIAQARKIYGETWDQDPNRGLYVDDEQVDRLLQRTVGLPLFFSELPDESIACVFPAQLEKLVQVFGLSEFDRSVLLLTIAPELDLRYERLYAYLQDDVTRKIPTVDLALNLFSTSSTNKLEHRSHFASDAPLIRQGLLQLLPDPHQVQTSSLAWFLKLDDRIIQFLLGQVGIAPGLRSIAQLHDPPFDSFFSPQNLQEPVQTWLNSPLPLRAYLQGETLLEQQNLAQLVAQKFNLSLLTVNLSQTQPQELVTLIQQIVRETQLWESLLHLTGIDIFLQPEQTVLYRQIWELLKTISQPVLLSGQKDWIPVGEGLGWAVFQIDPPDRNQRLYYWQQAITRSSLEFPAESLVTLADRFQLSREAIDRAVALAAAPNQKTPALSDLMAAARSQSTQTLTHLAQKLSPKYQWPDIILPPDSFQLLRDIGDQARHHTLVFETWGFDRKLSLGKGLNVLFAGPPGTGKTMAAEVIANDLELDVYKIDLSQIVSKYIGETEKNLDRIFTAATSANAILFFDEADALFGKRSDVKDAHDRYANIEVGYLLQKMEEYSGVAILATNLRQNMDDAFIRRLQIIIEFPFPDVEFREQIWKQVFPSEAPLDPTVDFAWLAQEVRLSGGNIKNIALAAAFLAAQDETPIQMRHLIQAAKREYQKLGQSWNVNTEHFV